MCDHDVKQLEQPTAHNLDSDESGQNSYVHRFVLASGVANLGDGIALVAWSWVASLMTRDPVLIAAVAIALRLPWVVAALPAGIITDRYDRRKLIFGMDLLRGAAFLGVTFALSFSLPFGAPPQEGVNSVPGFLSIIFAALVVGTAEVFRDNAAQTMMPAIASAQSLDRANGQLWSVELIGNALIGPAVGAAILSIALPAPFALNAGAYALAALIIVTIPGAFKANMERKLWTAELGEGIKYLQGSPLLKTLAWLTGFWNLFFQMVMIALVLHVQENLGLSVGQYGLVLAAGAVGGIVGGLFGDRVIRAVGHRRAAQWALLSSCPAFIAIALAPGLLSLAVVLALFEFAGLIWNSVSVGTRQRTIPDHLLGRVNSAYRLLAWGMMPVGLLLSGIIVNVSEKLISRDLALSFPFWVAAAGILIVALSGWRPLNRGLAAKQDILNS
jgi:MFS family permease